MSPYHLAGFPALAWSLLGKGMGFRVIQFEAVDGTGEHHKFTHQRLRPYLIHTAFWPCYWLGERIGRGITIEAILEA